MSVTVTEDPGTTISVNEAGSVTVEVINESASVTISGVAINGVPVAEGSPAAVETLAPTPANVQIESLGIPGSKGDKGDPGALGNQFTRIAASTLSAHRVVCTDDAGAVTYASNDDPSQATKQFWLTLDAANATDEVTVQSDGEISEPGWSWVPGEPIFLGLNGVMTQDAPTYSGGAAFIVQLAYPNTPTDVFYDPRTPILLGP